MIYISLDEIPPAVEIAIYEACEAGATVSEVMMKYGIAREIAEALIREWWIETWMIMKKEDMAARAEAKRLGIKPPRRRARESRDLNRTEERECVAAYGAGEHWLDIARRYGVRGERGWEEWLKAETGSRRRRGGRQKSCAYGGRSMTQNAGC